MRDTDVASSRRERDGPMMKAGLITTRSHWDWHDESSQAVRSAVALE
jgi:hypothetical protein